MALLEDLIFFDNPSIWHSFGGGYGGYGGVVWQMFIWSVIVALLVGVWLLYNLIYFRHTEGDPDHADSLKAGVFPHERGNVKIELAWTIAPLILVSWLTLISLGPLNYMWDVDGQEPDLIIDVQGGQWQWVYSEPSCVDIEDNAWCTGGIYQKPPEFTKCEEYAEREGVPLGWDCVEIPDNAIIHFRITSKDVLHAFYIPEIGIKQDAVPNLETLAWLDTGTVSAGEYNLYCTEFCGDSHSLMLGEIHITEVQ